MKAGKVPLSKKKITIIRKIKTDFASLNSLFGMLNRKEWHMPGLMEQWSAKEMVVHIAAF